MTNVENILYEIIYKIGITFYLIAYFFPMLFYAALFILQIVYLIITIKRKENYLWKRLFIIEAISLASVLFCFIALNLVSSPKIDILRSDIFWWPLLYTFIIYIIVLIVSVFIKLIFNKKINKDIKPLKMKRELMLIFIMSFVCVTLVIIPSLEGRIKFEKLSNIAIEYANKKYGKDNYEVNYIDVDDCGKSLCEILDDGTYEFSIKTSYLENNFTITYENGKLTDDFVSTYIHKKAWDISQMEKEVKDEIINEANKNITNEDGYKIVFDIDFDLESGKTFYGKLPTYKDVLELLKNTAVINRRYYMIYKTFNNSNEFIDFIMDLLNKYYKNKDSFQFDYKFVDDNINVSPNVYEFQTFDGTVNVENGIAYIDYMGNTFEIPYKVTK